MEPTIQAAFVDFGIGRNGFLHVSDVDPAYYRHLEGGRPPRDDRGYGRRDGGRGRRDDRPPRPERQNDDRPVQHEREHTEAARPAVPPPLPGAEREFGAGLFDDVTAAPPSEELPPAIDNLEPDAAGETEGGEQSAKPRRRRRGRRRGGKPRDAAGAPDSPTELGGPGSDAPPTVESAERRTEEDDPSFEGQLETGAMDVDPSLGDEPVDEQSDLNGVNVGEEPTDVEDSAPARGRRGGRDQRRGGRDSRGGRDPRRKLGRDGDGRPKPPIQEIFRRGQEVLVQVIKEGIGTKGPTLSTYISIAGR